MSISPDKIRFIPTRLTTAMLTKANREDIPSTKIVPCSTFRCILSLSSIFLYNEFLTSFDKLKLLISCWSSIVSWNCSEFSLSTLWYFLFAFTWDFLAIGIKIKLKIVGTITANPIFILPTISIIPIKGKNKTIAPTLGIAWLIACSTISTSAIIVWDISDKSCFEK